MVLTLLLVSQTCVQPVAQLVPGRTSNYYLSLLHVPVELVDTAAVACSVLIGTPGPCTGIVPNQRTAACTLGVALGYVWVLLILAH